MSLETKVFSNVTPVNFHMVKGRGFVVGVVPDYADGAAALESGEPLPAVFTADGETFHPTPDGLNVLDATRIPEIVARINDVHEYKDSVIFILEIAHNSENRAVDATAFNEGCRVFSPDEFFGLMSKEAVESRGYLALPHDPCRIRTAAGRNDPCPCGSGRKFKRCCIRK